jgi:transcriptional regulator with XRE-family HTH domain
LQEVQTQTIDQAIGANMRTLRETEGLTLAQCADTLWYITGESISEAKLSRWETGKYRFNVSDLHLISQVYGVNLLALLKPVDDDITHIDFGLYTIPVDDYVYDFFVDPRGRFVDRAERLAERRGEGDGTRDVLDAINDIRDRLGKRGSLGDLHSSMLYFGRIVTTVLAAFELNLYNPTPEHAQQYQDLLDAIPEGMSLRVQDVERIVRGLNQEDQ